ELLATLEAPVYIERVALCDNKNIMRARRAIRRALELQRDAAGFAFVEVLSPCPTIWGKDPVAARNWISDVMVQTFPLSVFRDRRLEVPELPEPPLRPLAEVLELNKDEGSVEIPAHSHSFQHLGIKIAGFGGQGVLLMGQLLAEMGMREGLEVSWLPSYGPEMRSGSAHCHVCLSRERVGSPLVSAPDVLVAMNEFSLRKFVHEVPSGAVILYNGSRVPEDFDAPGVQVLAIPAAEIADCIGLAKAANIVMLGALLEHTGALAPETAWHVLQEKVKRADLLELDRKALDAGREFADREVLAGAVSQPDGFA
ncbi:MAG TPA: 2-oxoacid:acceptor oxidoreductase family protein, partial [Terriglobales bacterium]|nr:2-oxoacid:acceptor oxidoreductase family protein [Terriglobales bacterium]